MNDQLFRMPGCYIPDKETPKTKLFDDMLEKDPKWKVEQHGEWYQVYDSDGYMALQTKDEEELGRLLVWALYLACLSKEWRKKLV